MPARKRPKQPPQVVDPITQFAQRLRAAEAEQQAAKDAEAAAAARAEALAAARVDLENAIAAVKAARQQRRGLAEADAAWREAKARVVELETGAAPVWAPAAPDASDASDDESASDGDDADSAVGSDTD